MRVNKRTQIEYVIINLKCLRVDLIKIYIKIKFALNVDILTYQGC